MTLETFKNLKPRDFEDYLGYVFMKVEPESVGSKETFQDNFDNWLQSKDLDYIMAHADSYAGLLVSYNVQNNTQTFTVKIAGGYNVTAKEIQDAIWQSGELSMDEITVEENV